MAISSEFELSEGRPWLRRLGTLAVLAAVGAGVAFGAWWFYFRGTGTSTVKTAQTTATVTIGNIVGTLTSSGSAISTQTTKLSFSGSGAGASGQVTSISVKVGDAVKAGQELARLDDTNAKRALANAQSNLTVAQLRYQALVAPPTADTLAAAQQSIISAQNQVQAAQAAYDKAVGPPLDTDVTAANAAVAQAQNGLQTAQNQVDSAWTALVSAQRNYCSVGSGQASVCGTYDIPLTDAHVADLNQELKNPTGTTAQITAIISAASGLLQANTSYANAKTGVSTAQKNLDSANAKLTALYTPPTADTMAQLKGAVDAANAGLATANAKLATLQAGPLATDIALQQQSILQAQNAVQVAQDNLAALVLTAPYDGTIGAVAMNVGDQASSASTITLTNTNGVRIDLSVSETDLPNVKAGEYGIATFDALPGETFIIKVSGVSTVPTVTQGVVTYAVQTQILRGPDLQANAADLQKLQSALGSLLGGGARGGFAGQGGPGASRSPNASRTPNPSRTPTAGRTGGAGGFGGFANPTVLPSGGMTANVTVVTNVLENALLLPTAAIKRQGRTNYVLLLKPDGTTEQRTITVGAADNTNTAILTGLAEGDKVLTGAAAGATASRTTAAGGGFGGPVFIGGGNAPGGVR